jgi:hypothetical protein
VIDLYVDFYGLNEFSNLFTVLRILDVYPGSRIQKQQWKTGVKNNLFPYLFLETKYWFWIWDPEKNPFRIPGSKRHRIRNTEKKVSDPDQLTSLITNLLLNRFWSLETCCSFSAARVTLGLANSTNIKGTLSQDFWLKALLTWISYPQDPDSRTPNNIETKFTENSHYILLIPKVIDSKVSSMLIILFWVVW